MAALRLNSDILKLRREIRRLKPGFVERLRDVSDSWSFKSGVNALPGLPDVACEAVQHPLHLPGVGGD
jgi:hypothetical protein